MFIIGHTALSYLVIRPFLFVDKHNLKPKTIFFIFIFANIIDIINIGLLRDLGHNLIGIFLFSGFWLLLFNRYDLIQKSFFPIFIILICLHVFADYLVSNFALFYPLNDTRYFVYYYDPHMGRLIEGIIATIFILFFITSKDFHKMKKFIGSEKIKFFKSFNRKNLFNPDLFIFYMFIAFYIFCFVQLFIFLRDQTICLTNLIAGVWLFFIMYILFIILLTAMAYDKNNEIQENRI